MPYIKAEVAKAKNVNPGNGVDGVDISFDPEVITADYVRSVKDAGFSFHVWTIDDLETARKAFAVGADTLTTNCAKKIRDEHASFNDH